MNIVDLLGELEQHLMLLSSKDQDLILGSIATVDAGGTLSQDALQRLLQIRNEVQMTQFGGVERPLSIRQILSELSSVMNRVPVEDRAFVVECSQHMNNLGEQAVAKLLQLHKAAGF